MKTGAGVKLAVILVLAGLSAAGGFYLAARYKSAPGALSEYSHEQAMAKKYRLSEEEKAFYASLDDLAARESAAKVGEYIVQKTTENPKLMGAALDWSRDNSILQRDYTRLNSLYFMLYSDLAYIAARAFLTQKMVHEFIDMSKTALASLLTFEMLLASDIARCKDASVQNILPQLITPRLAVLEYAYGLFTQEAMDHLAIQILTAESARLQRPPNPEICGGGVEASVALLEHEKTQRLKAADPLYPGAERTILVPSPDFEYKPEYVDQDTWMERRAEVQKTVAIAWQSRFDNLQMERRQRRAARARQDGDGPDAGKPPAAETAD